MARRKPFEQYRVTTKAERIIERKRLTAMQASSNWPKWLAKAFKWQHGECFYCDGKIDIAVRKSYHIEHRIPIYYGGKSDYQNLVLACPICNMVKGTQQLIRNKAHLNKRNQQRRQQVLYL